MLILLKIMFISRSLPIMEKEVMTFGPQYSLPCPPRDCCCVRYRAVWSSGVQYVALMLLSVTQLDPGQDVRLSNLTEKLYLTEQSQYHSIRFTLFIFPTTPTLTSSISIVHISTHLITINLRFLPRYLYTYIRNKLEVGFYVGFMYYYVF